MNTPTTVGDGQKLSFPSFYRLTKKHEFDILFAQGEKIRESQVLTFSLKNEREHARLGILVSKQSVRLASDRNRLRRVVRESFRQHQVLLKGLDILVLIRSECTPLSRIKWRTKVDKVWGSILTIQKAAG